jgi:cytochrome c oxidase subunit II
MFNEKIRKKDILFVLLIILVVSLFLSCMKSNDAFSKDSNGKKIYFTGKNSEGVKIPYRYGPHWLSMHGGGCVKCHGVDGRGGKPVMLLSKIPPDIRYSALTSPEHHHEGGKKDEGEKDEHEVAYKDEDIIKAIREGVEPNGEIMDFGMPRWNLSDKDAQDLLEFIKTLK